MKIFVFVEIFPSRYKPYYDSQFVDLLDSGHELTIFAYRSEPGARNAAVVAHGLTSLVEYYPTTLRHLPQFVVPFLANLVRHPLKSLRASVAGFRMRASFTARIASAFRAVLVARESPDFILIHSAWTAVAFRWLGSYFSNVPIATYYHGGEIPGTPELGQSVLTEAFQSADAIFTNTEFSRNQAISRGASPPSVLIQPVGFDLRGFPPLDHREYRRDGILRVVSAGRLSPEKGHLFAIKAVHRLVENGHRNVHYSIAGSGPLAGEIGRHIQEYGLEDHVTLLGTILTDDLFKLMRKSDVLMLPSQRVGTSAETQAAVVQEAMLCGALPVVSRTGGAPECIPPEFERFLVDEGDWEAMADALEQILAMDPETMADLGNRGRAFVEENFRVATMNEFIIQRTLEMRERPRAS